MGQEEGNQSNEKKSLSIWEYLFFYKHNRRERTEIEQEIIL